MLAEPLGMQSLLQRCQGWLKMLRMMYRCPCSPSALPWQMPSFLGARCMLTCPGKCSISLSTSLYATAVRDSLLP